MAELLDISPHERAGLVDVGRDAAGRRSYDHHAVRRLIFVNRMRLSGMGMRDVQHYLH